MEEDRKNRGQMASITNRQRYGEDFYKKIGAIGGKAKVPKGFAIMDKKKHIEASVKGGKHIKGKK
jgi:general stress protein YciG